MPLNEYRAKRDFTRSPEPAGDARPSRAGGPRFFCVQKHLASHLHYDFRLEHDGVLLSWAVPKGPALDPSTKRLAMHVEDHPVEYGTFEGVIPDGYGAGIVMLWDRGTWEAEVPDVAAALRKGDLKFRLDGVKLKGSWALVRTRSAGERSWLLIKHRDEWSGALDIAEFAPLSVKSGGDFADILAEGNPDVWISHRPAKGGDAGAMFAKIIARALEIKKANSRTPEEPSGGASAAPTKPRARATSTTARETATVAKKSAKKVPVRTSKKGPKPSAQSPRPAARSEAAAKKAPAGMPARKTPKAQRPKTARRR